MTDEPREETRPDEEEVEAHAPPTPNAEKYARDEDDDVEAHSPPTPRPPSPAPPTP
jgi:hypothetical protein